MEISRLTNYQYIYQAGIYNWQLFFSLMLANKLEGTAVQLDHLLGGGGKRKKIKSPFKSDLFLITSANTHSWKKVDSILFPTH